MILRSYQSNAIENLRKAYAKGRRAPLFVLPTGGGKTTTFAFIAKQTEARGSRVYILVHRSELMDQASQTLTAVGVEHGCIAPGHHETRALVQVASVQTVVRRLDRLPAPDLIIIDEAHHATAGTWRKIIAHFPIAKILGVTATPCRSDSQGLGIKCGGLFDELVEGPTIDELITLGFLVRPIVYAPPAEFTLDNIRTVGGDYDKAELVKRVDKPVVTGSAVEHYLKLANNEPAIVFCVSRAHADHVAHQFRAVGVSSVPIDGSLDREIRSDRIAALKDGRVKVLTSVDLVSEGFDLPAISCAISLRPTKSTGLWLQQAGRVLRPAPGKTRAIILDHVGNALRHGLPDEPREWSLNAERKKRRKGEDDGPRVDVRQCAKCYGVFTTGIVCPFCGYVMPVKERKLEVREGELKALTMEAARKARLAARREQGKAKTLEELQALARATGKSQGWAWHVWNSRRK